MKDSEKNKSDKRKSEIPRRLFLKGIGAGTLAAASISSLAKPVAPLLISSYDDNQSNIGPLRVNLKSGQLVNIVNSFTGVDYPLEKWRFQLELEGVNLTPDSARAVTHQEAADNFRFYYDYPDFFVEQIIRSVPVKGFAEYVLRVRRKDKQPFYVLRVTCGEFQFRNRFDETILHTDGSILKTPINLFLRSQGGGAILGLAYPYQEILPSKDGRTFTLGYETEVAIAAGDQFESEPLFVGVYAFSGIGIFKPLEQVPYRFITPHPEERDLAEIQAMREYVRTKLPYHSVRDVSQFHMMLNSWWADKPLSELQDAVDLMAQLGVPDILTRETYYGNCQHIARCEKLENLPDGFRLDLPAQARKVISYGKSKGVRLATFVTPCRAFRPEWEVRNKDGKPVMYGEVRSVCFASREAADFTLNLWDRMLKDAGSAYLGFDGRILTSFNEVDLGFGAIGPIACFASNHGHKPRHNFYLDYKNGQYLFGELRRRNPGVFLEVYWGIKRAMPWDMASFNGCESWYESNSHQDDRMQSWYNQNYRFLPSYKNFAQVRGYTDPELRKSILSCISISSHLQLGIGVKILDRPNNQEFFRQWTGWASQNHRFLKVKRDLFGQPGAVALDGSAHIIEDHGYLFLFNESGSDKVGSIPLNELIGLTRGANFDIQQIYPREQLLQRSAKRGQTVLIPVAASEVVVVFIKPTVVTTKALPGWIWHNLGQADVKLTCEQLVISGLEGYQNQRREIVVLMGGRLPRQLIINGQKVSFKSIGNAVLAEIAFEPVQLTEPINIGDLWEGSAVRLDGSGSMLVEEPGLLRSRRKLGSGIYEIDMLCEFARGGLFFKADPGMQKGVVATALLSHFAPIDGNIGLWDTSFQQFPIHWTRGENLKKNRPYRFRVETYGDRHSFSILDPSTGKTLAGPLTYRVETVEPEGLFGIRLEKGSARLTRFAFAPSKLSRVIRSLEVNIASLVEEAFMSREFTRKMGQWAPAGTRMPVGAESTIEFDYLREQEKFRG